MRLFLVSSTVLAEKNRGRRLIFIFFRLLAFFDLFGTIHFTLVLPVQQ